MRFLIVAALATIIVGCATTTPRYSGVPKSVPPEAKPIWVMFDAAQQKDLARLKSVCTPTRVNEIEAMLNSDKSAVQKMFQELTQMLPRNGVGGLELKA